MASNGFGKPILTIVLLTAVAQSTAYGFNSSTHAAITQSAFTHLKNQERPAIATQDWLRKGGLELQRLLTRSTVDVDYIRNVWFDSLFHSPFTGAKDKTIVVFTQMSHFINMSSPGTFWQNDGYAYKNTNKTGNDGYLGIPFLNVLGRLSSIFGGLNPAFPLRTLNLGVLRLGFRGDDKDWETIFHSDRSASEVIFPPANIPAELAFNSLLSSIRATSDSRETWNEVLPLADGIFSTTDLSRFSWRAEIRGLPQNIDLLGIPMHMVQDLCVPHHALGTADYCHPEFETLADELSCGGGPIEQTEYENGTADQIWELPGSNCQNIYDAKLVDSLLRTLKILQVDRGVSMGEFLRRIATLTSKWWWGPYSDTDLISTKLPSGIRLTADSCSTLLQTHLVRERLRYQYNLAVAATIVILEWAAGTYEKAHSG